MSSVPAPGVDVAAPASTVIEVRVAELRQLFNAIDPSPFRERDRDPRAEAFIGGMSQSRCAAVRSEGLIIGGWVAMWRPLEGFLYDWWPVRADVRLFERLGAMPVDVEVTR